MNNDVLNRLYELTHPEASHSVKYPCRNCKYFNACGEKSRTVPCEGRETRGGRKHERNGSR